MVFVDRSRMINATLGAEFGKRLRGGNDNANTQSFGGVSQANALQAAQGVKPVCKLFELCERVELDLGLKRHKVGDVNFLNAKWESLMRERGTQRDEETDPGVNVVKVEHRPAWDQLIFMGKDMDTAIVSVRCEEAAAEFARQGYKRLEMKYYSSRHEIPVSETAASSRSGSIEQRAPSEVSGKGALASEGDGGEPVPESVTVPQAFPNLNTSGCPTAAEQIVEQFEVCYVPFFS